METACVDLKTHPLNGVSLIEASAGTGKTFTITHLYVRCLLETDYEVNQILVVTFTNAATQELKGRIRELVYDVWDYLINGTEKKPHLDTLFGEYIRNQQAIFKLQKALVNFDEASIFSIHSFCQRVLNSFPLETHSLLQQQIIPDEREIELSAIRDYWRKNIVSTELEKLRWIISNWNHPDQLLKDVRPLMGFEQFVQQSANALEIEQLNQNIQQRWKKLCEYWLNHHDEVNQILINNPAISKGKVRTATVDVLFKALEILFSGTAPYALPMKWELITTRKLISCLNKNKQDERLYGAFFQRAEEFEILHAEWIVKQKIAILIDTTQNVQKTINETKSNALNISFNDLIKQLSDVLNPQNISLVKKVNTLYPLAMVDEFQDTDNKQYSIFKTLYQGFDDRALIMIGDPKQAIYSFRGADVFTYQLAKQSTDRHFTLDTNYRSTASYINLVNGLFEVNQNAFIFEQLIDFIAASDEAGKNKSLTDGTGSAAPLVSWIHPFTEKPISRGIATDYFARLCAREIHHILQHKTLQLDGETVAAKDLTILVKTGRQASLMKSKLAELGISSALILRDSVFATVQAREISLLLEVLIEFSDVRRLCGLLSTDLFGWNTADIFQLQQNNQQLVNLLEQMKAYHSHWQEKGILSMFFKLMEDQQSLQKNIQHIDGERRVTNWLHIMELLQQQSSQHASLSQALRWLLQQREQAMDNNKNEEHQLRLETDGDLVRIVTIHKSKGLEYPIVFLPFMWDIRDIRNKPASYSYHDRDGNKKIMLYDEAQRERWFSENQAEEIRLFYVAMTRARYRCYLAWGHINGAGSSAIAHCLFSDYGRKGKYPYDLELNDARALRRPFVTLNHKLHQVDIVEKEITEISGLLQAKAPVEQTAAKRFTRKIQQQWRISSYSQIASTGHIEQIDRPDYDAVDIPRPDNTQLEPGIDLNDELTRFTFQKGARAGNFLHDLLEYQSFDEAIDTNLIQQKCQEYGFDEKWIPCLVEWIEDILNCNLGNLKLSQLRPEQKISEMEFYMSSKNLQPDLLNQLMQEYPYSRPEQSFSFSNVKGFLKGFIDLVFEHKGQYFIADYKSNYLGFSQQYYDEDNCMQAMFDHHYHLQYLIYTLAIHRYLKQRLTDYDYNRHFGGVYYLFLRGMSESDAQQHGVFFHKPSIEVIQRLDKLFKD